MFHQPLMLANIDNLPLSHHQDSVCVHNRCEAMRNDEGRAVMAELIERCLNQALTFSIQRIGRLI
jgi:hypothetical protein